jgi:hypothetical protein
MQEKTKPHADPHIEHGDQDSLVPPGGQGQISPVEEFLPLMWYLLADRIAPQLCCHYPPLLNRMFLAAVREVSRQDGDLDKAVTLLHDIIIDTSAGEMLLEQTGQLLNIIEWRRSYHPLWFPAGAKSHRLKPGRCSSYISQAMVLFQTGADEDALVLTEKILKSSQSTSDVRCLAYLIRAVVLICIGEVATAEEELANITAETLID